MFSILIFLALQKQYLSQIFASGTWDHHIRIWNHTNIYLENKINNKNLLSLEYDSYNKQILAGCKEKSIFLWNIMNNTQRTFLSSVSVHAILFLNSTHFMTGSTNILVIYRFFDGTNQTLTDGFGIISDMKILERNNMVLIATNSSKIIVFDLINVKFFFNLMIPSHIVSIDCLNRNFIVAQCENSKICLLYLNSTNSLKSNKTHDFSVSCKIFSIKIVNYTFIVFGIDDSSDRKIGMWNLLTNNYQSIEKDIIVLEILDQAKIVYAENDNDIKFANITNIDNEDYENDLKQITMFLKRIEPSNLLNSSNTETSTPTPTTTSTSTFTTTPTTTSTSTFTTTPTTTSTSTLTTTPTTKLTTTHSTTFTTTPTTTSISTFTITPTTTSTSTFTTTPTTTSTSTFTTTPTTTSISTFTTTPITTSTSTFAITSTTKLTTTPSTTSTSTATPTTKLTITSTTTEIQQQFLVSDQNIEVIVDLISSDIDMSACLVNCSGHGKCKMMNQALYSCECFDNYSGSSCQINTLPCSSNPCINNGTCENNLVDKKYKCECYSENNQTSLYYGQNCENKIDICQNETCSKNGVCNDVNDEIKCKCFGGYSGEKCELESNETKVIKSVITVASFIAIIIIVSFFFCLICMDVSKICCKQSNNNERIRYIKK